MMDRFVLVLIGCMIGAVASAAAALAPDTTTDAAPADPSLVDGMIGYSLPIPFRQFSGVIQVSEKRSLWYILTESSRDPLHDPLVLWLSGGPGCSGMAAYFLEHGPFQVNPDLTLTLNQYRWNSVASVIYLDSPSGVGYSPNREDPVAHPPDDTRTANDTLTFLLEFYARYPQYKTVNLYIAGESYAGVYVTVLVQRIDQYNHASTPAPAFALPLVGYLIGNGQSDDTGITSQVNTYVAQLDHGLMTRNQTGVLIECLSANASIPNPVCAFAIAAHEAQIADINPYAMEAECEAVPIPSQPQAHTAARFKRYQHMIRKGRPPRGFSSWKQLFEITGAGTGRAASATGSSDPIYSGNVYPPCFSVSAGLILNYLTQPTVITALHAPPPATTNFTICQLSVAVYYNHSTPNTIPIQRQLMLTGRYYGMVYHGDADANEPVRSGYEWVRSLVAPNVVNAPFKDWTPWYVEHPIPGRQVGGYVSQWMWPNAPTNPNTQAGSIQFTSVHGASHLVPWNRPVSALRMFASFLDKNDLCYASTANPAGNCMFGCSSTGNWAGKDCSIPVCSLPVLKGCGNDAGHGVCVAPNVCACRDGWSGLDCSIQTPQPTPNGSCDSGGGGLSGGAVAGLWISSIVVAVVLAVVITRRQVLVSSAGSGSDTSFAPLRA